MQVPGTIITDEKGEPIAKVAGTDSEALMAAIEQAAPHMEGTFEKPAVKVGREIEIPDNTGIAATSNTFTPVV